MMHSWQAVLPRNSVSNSSANQPKRNGSKEIQCEITAPTMLAGPSVHETPGCYRPRQPNCRLHGKSTMASTAVVCCSRLPAGPGRRPSNSATAAMFCRSTGGLSASMAGARRRHRRANGGAVSERSTQSGRFSSGKDEQPGSFGQNL